MRAKYIEIRMRPIANLAIFDILTSERYLSSPPETDENSFHSVEARQEGWLGESIKGPLKFFLKKAKLVTK